MGEMAFSCADFELRRQAWESEFPGQAISIQTLREAVIFADQELQKSTVRLKDFDNKITATGKPMEAWPDRVLRFYQQIKKLHKADTALFHKSLSALQQQYQSKPKIKAEPEEPAQPKELEPVLPGCFTQCIRVSVVDGQTVTRFDTTPEHWLRQQAQQYCSFWARTYGFTDKIIPKEYEYVMAHRGQYYGPAEFYFIQYPPDEFMRMCQREVDNGDGHAIDGVRVGYDLYLKCTPQERPLLEETHGQDEPGPIVPLPY